MTAPPEVPGKSKFRLYGAIVRIFCPDCRAEIKIDPVACFTYTPFSTFEHQVLGNVREAVVQHRLRACSQPEHRCPRCGL